MTKAEATHEFKIYLSDLRDDGKREGYKVDRQQTWEMMIEGWFDAELIDRDTAQAWLRVAA